MRRSGCGAKRQPTIPTRWRQEANWLEVHDAALLLEAARTHKCAYPLLATFLLTGRRESEVLGLEVGDVSFDRKTVTFRPNGWRRLKTGASFRTVPLWQQRRYLAIRTNPEPGPVSEVDRVKVELPALTGDARR